MTKLESNAHGQTADTSQDRVDGLVERRLHRRAVEAAIWGMPAVNYELMRTVMSSDESNQFVYWSRLLDWHNQTLTPNPDLIYYMAFMDTRDGPVVVDIPASGTDQALNGTLCSVWQMPLVDIGKLGEDHGQGGRFVILPPATPTPSLRGSSRCRVTPTAPTP